MSTFKEQVERYIGDVLSDRIPTGRLCKLAVSRHVMDLSEGPKRGLHFNEDIASEWCNFFPTACVHTTGEYDGEPFKLRDFQAFTIWVLFGWKRTEGTRRFRDAFISFARGNGKSPLGAGIGLGLGFMDIPREPRAEVYCAATKKDQAKIVWDEGRRMVERGPLRDLVTVMQLNMHAKDNGSKFEPLGSDSNVTDGLVIHGVIRDELHAWKEQHRGLYEKIETAMGKRRQPLGVTITTAGDDRAEIWKEKYQDSAKVVEQVLNPPSDPSLWFGDEHFSFICELDKEDDIYDETLWPKANPMLLEPRSPVKIDHIRNLVAKAKRGDISSEFMARRYHFNQMVASIEKAFTVELWNKGNRDVGYVHGMPCYGGLDLGRSNDFSAVTLVWSLGDSEYAVRTWVWTCQERSEALRTNEFQSLMKSENVFIHSGNQILFSDIRKKIVELQQEFNVKRWGFDDSWARETGQWMKEEHGLDVQPWAQTCRGYNEPIVRFTDALMADKVRHGADPMLRWQAGNLILRKNAADLRMPDKVNSPYKIDSMVALFMAFGECLFAEKSQEWAPDEIGL